MEPNHSRGSQIGLADRGLAGRCFQAAAIPAATHRSSPEDGARAERDRYTAMVTGKRASPSQDRIKGRADLAREADSLPRRGNRKASRQSKFETEYQAVGALLRSQHSYLMLPMPRE